MGGSFDTITFPGTLTEKQLRERFDDHQREQRLEHGSGSYAGHLGIKEGLTIRSELAVFASYDDAQEWLSENNGKWGNADAVRYREARPLTDKEKRKILVFDGKIEDAREKLNATFKAKRDQFFNAKGKFVGCKECGSKLNRSRLTTGWMELPACPLCKTPLMSDTALNGIEKKKKAVDAQRQKKCDFLQTLKEGGEEAWLIGGWCSS